MDELISIKKTLEIFRTKLGFFKYLRITDLLNLIKVECWQEPYAMLYPVTMMTMGLFCSYCCSEMVDCNSNKSCKWIKYKQKILLCKEIWDCCIGESKFKCSSSYWLRNWGIVNPHHYIRKASSSLCFKDRKH